ncbi:hypothetical protein [Azospirillum argentinense]
MEQRGQAGTGGRRHRGSWGTGRQAVARRPRREGGRARLSD